ncbi:ABC transporter substrate-binding protein [Williamsia sp. 1135]|uniref:ABC transporter substrate-binding protein n=1 Tax=Williamsia sp. 1135 TaxID=1889262 RepID=UPI001F0A77F6|nr:ABC transporter substrate-binding protein [Williamsia sp. 1135]
MTGVVSTNGSDTETFHGYYSLEGSGIETAQDLVGKKVGINTLGAYHEYAIKEWLYREGISDADIKNVGLTVVPPINTELALREKQIEVGNLVSRARSPFAVSGVRLPPGGVVVGRYSSAMPPSSALPATNRSTGSKRETSTTRHRHDLQGLGVPAV